MSGDTAERPIRVALVAHDIHWEGGMERAMAELISTAPPHVRFTVVSATLAPELRHLVEWRRVDVPRRPFPAKFTAFYIRSARAVRGLDVDLIHTCGALTAARADLASVHFCHHGYVRAARMLSAGGPPLRRVNTTVSRLLALAAERVAYRPSRLRLAACVSDGVAREMHVAFPGLVTAITPNGVDSAHYRPDPATRAAVRDQHGAGAATVALFVGGDWNRKGLPIAIEAVRRARRGGSDVVLWVVGSGDVGRMRREHGGGVEEVVTFLGAVKDPAPFYVAADVLVLPSLYETFSLVAHEAAACGLPVVGTRVHGVDALVTRGEGGLMVERGAEAFAEALVALAEDPPARRRLGDAGRRYAHAHPWRASVRAVTGAYDELVRSDRGDAETPGGARRPSTSAGSRSGSIESRNGTTGQRQGSRPPMVANRMMTGVRRASATVGAMTGEARSAVALTAAGRSRARLLTDVFVYRAIRGHLVTRSDTAVRTVTLRDGQRVRYRRNRGDLQSFREVFYDRHYEPLPGMTARTILDVGANIGLTSIWLARQFPGAVIVAVEPAPDNADLVRQNAVLNGAQVTVVEGAVACTEGTTTFAASAESNLGRLAEGGDLVVRTTTLARLLDSFPSGRADILKLDVEGAEAEILLNDDGALQRVGAVATEFHPQVTGVADAVLEEALRSAGFTEARGRGQLTTWWWRPEWDWGSTDPPSAAVDDG
ncbi:FkbM family methyltransferase [Miltoncostaea oceani]|uniref:FkbM family methyltransferase n=1 Tax=Miltoncostaea oceani TaxID=2843216 RepID=UPI001C3CE7E6|nr:FkbM family methyltransferase [Miltoncostaea oceani]